MTTTLELQAAIDRVRLVRSGVSLRYVYESTTSIVVHTRHRHDEQVIVEHCINQLDRDALEEATPCPDCDVIDEHIDENGTATAAYVEACRLYIDQTNEKLLMYRSSMHDCQTLADLRRWCAALGVEMPDVAK